jgi:hypothetical protein
MALCLAPLDVAGQTVQVWEQDGLVNSVPKQRVLQGLSLLIRYLYSNKFSSIRVEVLRRNRMRCEHSALRTQSGSYDSRNVSDRLLDLERAALRERLAQIHFGTTPCNDLSVFTTRTSTRIAGFAFFADTEVKRDEWAAGPVEQSRGKAVMLRNRQQFPVIRRSDLKTVY